jgi:hypothetical protein
MPSTLTTTTNSPSTGAFEPYVPFHHLSSLSLQQQQEQQHEQDHLYRVRERQWIYLGPIAAAPLAHIGVTLYGSSLKNESGRRGSSSTTSSTTTSRRALWMIPQQTKRQILVGGIAATTVLTIGMRLYLMVHAGYPGGPNQQMAERERIVTKDEKYKLEHASTMEIAKAAAKGFG